MPPTLLLLAALAAPPQLDLSAAAVDPEATAAGLRARAGASLDGWTISVRDAGPNKVEARLRSPAGQEQRRKLTLTGATTDDRSRELAASLALLVEEDAPPPPPNKKTASTPADESKPPRTRGWLGLGPRLEVGVPPAGGLDLAGGAWLLREHLQPLVDLAWTSTAQAGQRMHSLRLGGGAAGGAALKAGRIWLGGHVLLHARWVQARDVDVTSTWTFATEVGGLVQVRWSRVLLAARTGVDLGFPPLTLRGTAAQISRGPAAWVLAVNFGFVFG